MAIFEIKGIVWSNTTAGLPSTIEHESNMRLLCLCCCEKLVAEAAEKYGEEIEDYDELNHYLPD